MNAGRVYVIAEAGVNHNGNRQMAMELVEAAAAAGADAVKFQTFNAVKLATRTAPKAKYQLATTGSDEIQAEMLGKLELPREWHADLQALARSKGIEFLSTAFDHENLHFLVDLGVPVLKVPSGELTNSALVWQYGRMRKPLLVSTGMACLSEVETALAVIVHALNSDEEPDSMATVWRAWCRAEWRARLSDLVVLLHCTSQYPAPPAEVNLRAMDTLSHAFGLRAGYSDHTEGIVIPIAAVARGASVIEKHLTLSRALPGPDHRASLEPAEFADMVGAIRATEASLGDGRKVTQLSEWDTRRAAYEQVVAARNIDFGSRITREDLTTARCGVGLPAANFWDLIGRVARRAYLKGEALEG